jgi:hypothetical protein
VFFVKKVALKDSANEMMAIEDNSDLRAALNFAQNAIIKVLHVYIVTQDAPKGGDKTTLSQVPLQDDSFCDAVKELTKNNQSRD